VDRKAATEASVTAARAAILFPSKGDPD